MGYFPYTYAVFGAMGDKDIEGVVKQIKGEIDHWNVTALPTPRAASAEQLEHVLHDAGVNDSADSSVARFEAPAAAFQDALSRATENDRILVFGSFYTVAGVMAYRRMQHN
jgi:dihydrofolate synthase/folylpolyglutamate synthase